MDNIIVKVDETTKGLINHLQSELTGGLNQQLRNIQSNLNQLVESSSKDLILSIQDPIIGIHQTLKKLDESFKDIQEVVEDIESDTSGLSSSIKNLNVDTLSDSIHTLKGQLQSFSNLSSIVETISFNKQLLLDEQDKSTARDANIKSLENLILDGFDKKTKEIKSETVGLSEKIDKNAELLSLLNELLNKIEDKNNQRDERIKSLDENIKDEIDSQTNEIKSETAGLSEKIDKNAELLSLLNELLNKIENKNHQRDKAITSLGESLNETIGVQINEIKEGNSSLMSIQREGSKSIETKILELQNTLNKSIITEVSGIKEKVDHSQKVLEDRLTKIEATLIEIIEVNQETNISWYKKLHDIAFRILYTVTPFWKKKKLDEDN